MDVKSFHACSLMRFKGPSNSYVVWRRDDSYIRLEKSDLALLVSDDVLDANSMLIPDHFKYDPRFEHKWHVLFVRGEILIAAAVVMNMFERI